jgi:hypothetical protein
LLLTEEPNIFGKTKQTLFFNMNLISFSIGGTRLVNTSGPSHQGQWVDSADASSRSKHDLMIKGCDKKVTKGKDAMISYTKPKRQQW